MVNKGNVRTFALLKKQLRSKARFSSPNRNVIKKANNNEGSLLGKKLLVATRVNAYEPRNVMNTRI